jgi:ParB-like chromosome segregation protein Spo0J
VLTPAVLAEAQQLLDDGFETAEVADRLGVKRNTLSKAVRAGRLHQPVSKKSPLKGGL